MLFARTAASFPVEISLSPIESEEGTLVISTIRDITERKQIEAQLHEKERLATLGTTAAIFAHEIANPLNGIATSSGAGDVRAPSCRQRACLRLCHNSLSRNTKVDFIANRIPIFCPPHRIQLEPTDLRPIVKDALTTIVRGHNGTRNPA